MSQSFPSVSLDTADSPLLFAHDSVFSAFFACLDEAGAPTNRWLARAHMPTGQIEQSAGLVPLRAGYRFLALAAEGGFDDIGVTAALRTSVFDLGTYGSILSQASTIYEYLQLGSRLVSSLSSGGTKIWLRRENDKLRVCMYLAGSVTLGAQIGEVFTLVLTIETLKRMLGDDWSPDELRLRSGTEKLLGDWMHQQAPELVTDQPFSSFTLPLALLNRPLANHGGHLSEGSDIAKNSTKLMPDSFIESMEYLITLLICEGSTDMQNAADAAGLSIRTLQRKLAQSGTSYRSLLNAISLRLAKQRLCNSSLRVTDIAAELGYTDASNFARAFQNQTGLTPSAYRLAQQR